MNINGIGQVITYTCKKGYEFIEEVPLVTPVPTTTTTTTTPGTTTLSNLWKEFAGAHYYLGNSADTDSWDIARQKCQSLNANADLASVTSWSVQKFLIDTFPDMLGEEVWIGGKQVSGAFTWINGDTYEYQYTDCGFQVDDKLCLRFRKDKDWRWDREDCATNNIDYFLCQTGTSTAKFWNTINGAEFSHLENDCIVTADAAQASCQSYGGHLASVLTRNTLDQLQTTFRPESTQRMWIGLHDSNTEETLEWRNGDAYHFTHWSSSGDDNDDDTDCVSLSPDNFHFKNNSCDSSSINGYICQKGSTGNIF